MPQRKPSNKLPEIGECLELLQSVESNLSEEDFQTIHTVKEYLDVIKAKWKSLNANYKNLFQEKTNCEGEIEKMTLDISKMNDKHINELKMIQEKLISCENNAMKQLSENKVLIEQLELDKSKLNDLLNEEKSKEVQEQNEILSLFTKISELERDLRKNIEDNRILKTENDRILFDLRSKNDELLSKLNILSDLDLKNHMIVEEMEKLRVEKDHRMKVLEARISSLQYEKEQDSEKLGEQIQMLQSQKKNAENLLTELTIKLDKKSKCCLM
jgi:chromosome segregation ATPase